MSCFASSDFDIWSFMQVNNLSSFSTFVLLTITFMPRVEQSQLWKRYLPRYWIYILFIKLLYFMGEYQNYDILESILNSSTATINVQVSGQRQTGFGQKSPKNLGTMVHVMTK